MPGLATSSFAMCCRLRGKHAHLQPHAPRRTARLASSSQLMAQGSGLVLPRLGAVQIVHRLVADDRLAVMLAEALLELDIAVPGDWKKAERDPKSLIRVTLERWIRAHGGLAIGHRFLLSAVISNSPSDWAAARSRSKYRRRVAICLCSMREDRTLGLTAQLPKR